MAITIPISYILLFFLGLFQLGRNTINELIHKKLSKKTFQEILFLALWFIPIFAVIILKSIVYDGWRHLYFTYPAFLLLAISGLNYLVTLLNFNALKTATLAAVILVPNLFFIVKNHPNQQVYFNELVQNPNKTFELDYWGASFAQGLRFIAQKDKRDTIKIKIDGLGISNHNLLSDNDKKRLILEPNLKKADYYLTHYRCFSLGDSCTFNPNLPDSKQFPFKNEIFNVQSGKAKILGVYKLK